MNKSEYDYMVESHVNNLDDILQIINHERNWKLDSLTAIAEKVTYHYGGGSNGLIQAMYNLLCR